MQLESIFPKSLISVLNSTTDSLVKVSGPVIAVQWWDVVVLEKVEKFPDKHLKHCSCSLKSEESL